MPDAKAENGKAKGTIGVLRLQRETLRELGAGELQQAQGGGRRTSYSCQISDLCTRGCGSSQRC